MTVRHRHRRNPGILEATALTDFVLAHPLATLLLGGGLLWWLTNPAAAQRSGLPTPPPLPAWLSGLAPSVPAGTPASGVASSGVRPGTATASAGTSGVIR